MNCNITRQDVLTAEYIFWPKLGSVKGINIRCLTKHVKITWTKVPRELLEKYVDMTLAIDIMAINKYHLWSAHHATYIWYC